MRPAKPYTTSRVSISRVAYRFVLGRELDGVKRTNARWRHPGLEPRSGFEHTTWWTRQPYRRRAAIRLAVTVWLVVHAAGVVADWSATVVTLRVELGLGLLVVGFVVVHRYRKFSHREGVVVPVGQVVAEWLGYDRHVDPLNLVKVPLGYRTNPDKPIEISLPKHYAETERRQLQLASHVAGRAGIKSHDYEVLLEGEAPRMLVRAQLVPPDEVLLSDETAAELVRGNDDDSKLFIGLGVHDRPVWIDWNQDAPHLAPSIGSGGGKSTLVRSLAAQTVYKGGRAVIFDGGKDGESHEDWTRDEGLQLLNGVEFYSSIEAEHDALVAWEAERQRRAQAVLARTGEKFQRTLLVLEERNVTMPKLAAYWAGIRCREDGDPVKSPAIQAIANLVAAGRSVKMNVVAVAQRFDAAAIGGGSVRSNFGLRLMSRFDEQARKMLIPEIKPAPKSSNRVGRAVLCVAGEATDVQVLYMETHEAVDMCRNPMAPQASSRIIAPRPKSPALAASLGDLPVLGQSQVPSAEPVPVPVAKPPERLMKLSEAVAQGVVGMNIEALRKAAQRPGFPAPWDEGKAGAKLYDPRALAAWFTETREADA